MSSQDRITDLKKACLFQSQKSPALSDPPPCVTKQSYNIFDGYAFPLQHINVKAKA
ncbi:Hypothetical protein GbCGDNIH7_2431 [Granulibacter bethesdensis]|nr:Hypothetical protein GbCGDNIH7_2431 [Granulibacter bethesdensis]